ncbi:MAG: hypothetical protein IMZ64_07440 [Bacteroidetes bacterium]|nr:hypothetical protein [Bacteroidota bacterium]
MITTQQLFKAVKDHAEKTYGTQRDPEKMVDDLLEAVEGLGKEVRRRKQGIITEHIDLLVEIGEVQINLFELCQRMGVCFNSWNDAIRIKHRINVKGNIGSKE